MTFSRRTALRLVLMVILVTVGGWWLADAWLESSGGRALLERELSRRAGIPVRLAGDFDLMLLPSIGVSGTRLVIGPEHPGSELFSSSEYEVSVALYPLLQGEVLVEWIRLSGGQLQPPGVDSPLRIESLTISDFAADRPTPFVLKVAALAAMEGVFRWESARQALQFSEFGLDTAGGLVRGRGCVIFHSPLSVRLDLSAESLDLDAVRQSLPASLPDGAEGTGESPTDIRIRLTAAELRAAGVVARETEFSVGGDPDCGR